MHELLLSFLVFSFSSIINISFSFFGIPASTIHKIIGVLILPVFLLIYGYKIQRIKTFIQQQGGKWWTLFLLRAVFSSVFKSRSSFSFVPSSSLVSIRSSAQYCSQVLLLIQ